MNLFCQRGKDGHQPRRYRTDVPWCGCGANAGQFFRWIGGVFFDPFGGGGVTFSSDIAHLSIIIRNFKPAIASSWLRRVSLLATYEVFHFKYISCWRYSIHSHRLSPVLATSYLSPYGDIQFNLILFGYRLFWLVVSSS